MTFHIFTHVLQSLWVYYKLTMWSAPSWHDSTVGRPPRLMGLNPVHAWIFSGFKFCNYVIELWSIMTCSIFLLQWCIIILIFLYFQQNSWLQVVLCKPICYIIGTWVSNYRYPIWTVCYWIHVIGYPCDSHVNYACFNGFHNKVSDSFQP